MPGGSIPAMEVARGWTRPASPNGFPNCSCAAAAEDEGMLGARPATGEVGSETGDTEDCGWLRGASVTYRRTRYYVLLCHLGHRGEGDWSLLRVSRPPLA